ncbi:MAG: 16S rRNA (guanine(966)-N(2))-methyltransferase RsmD [Clostridiaceae bacterium]
MVEKPLNRGKRPFYGHSEEDGLRIIAGTARGRKFDAPKGMDTRPTLERVKESMFGIIQFELEGSSVLDLFSGSGNLGLEAASRGAAYVVCNDRSRDCAEQIQKTAERLKLDEIVKTTCLDYANCIDRLKYEKKMFDFVFLDAPYADGTAAKAAEKIFAAGILKEGARVIIEHASKFPPVVDASLAKAVDTRRYGACAITIYIRP